MGSESEEVIKIPDELLKGTLSYQMWEKYVEIPL
jgi:hypothetical protein